MGSGSFWNFLSLFYLLWLCRCGYGSRSRCDEVITATGQLLWLCRCGYDRTVIVAM